MKTAVFVTLALLLTAVIPAGANLVQPLGSSNQILIPAAGRVPGANGTFFLSDITILNYRNVDQEIQLFWLPQGRSAGAAELSKITINARSGISSADFVGDVLRQNGLGSVVITALLPGTSTVDPNARLFATARIWTEQPGTGGTTSQTFSTLPLGTINSTSRLAMVGIRRDAQYRLNVGLVNVDNTFPQTLQITLGNSLGGSEVVTVTVPPLSMQQVSFPGPPFANPQILVENVTPAATRSARWTSYASSIDNVTGDSWSVIGFERPDQNAP